MSSPFETLIARHPQSRLFADLSGTARLRLGDLSTSRRCKAGEVLIAEGAVDPYLYVIRSGRVRIEKATSAGVSSHALNELGPGETFGEMKLAAPGPASATVVAVEPVEVFCIDLERLGREPDADGLRVTLLTNVARILSERLRGTSAKTANAIEAELQQVRLREYAGRFIVYLFTIMSGFAFIVAGLNALGPQRPRQALISAGVIFGAALPVAIMLRRSPYAPADYGLTLQRWRRVLGEALLYTVPILALATLLKGAWLLASPGHRKMALLDPLASGSSTPSWGIWLLAVVSYSCLSALQEFFARCGLQASMLLFDGRSGARSNWRVILIANLMFASAHAYLGLRFMLAAFIPGLFWGWLFDRQRSLLGVAVSHALIGVWALFVIRLQVIVGGQ